VKTIKTGAVPPPAQWWVGKRVKCLCGFVGEIEAGDEKKPGVQIFAARSPNGPRSIIIPCPTCGESALYNWEKTK
jgi:hypothetical protein